VCYFVTGLGRAGARTILGSRCSTSQLALVDHTSLQRNALGLWDENGSMSRTVLGADAARFSKKSRRNRRSLRRVCPNRQMPALSSKITSKTVADC
jgi:hypothetical protein